MRLITAIGLELPALRPLMCKKRKSSLHLGHSTPAPSITTVCVWEGFFLQESKLTFIVYVQNLSFLQSILSILPLPQKIHWYGLLPDLHIPTFNAQQLSFRDDRSLVMGKDAVGVLTTQGTDVPITA